MPSVTLNFSQLDFDIMAAEARSQNYSGVETWLTDLLESCLEPRRPEFTACEDERYVLDPGGGVILSEDI